MQPPCIISSSLNTSRPSPSPETYPISSPGEMQIEHLDEATGGIMTPEHRAQMRRLSRFRESARIARRRAALEALAATHTPPTARTSVPRVDQPAVEDNDGNNMNVDSRNQVLDPLIFPGLYAPSGFNIMNILVRVRLRPNPQIDLGFIDSSCALLLCDLSLPDTPIVYASEPFSLLTRYAAPEILGRNCRFLQSPTGAVQRGARREFTDEDAVRELREKLAGREETQVTVTNYKKGGERFENILTVVPIAWEEGGEVRYVVGFQADRQNCFLGPVSLPPPPQQSSSLVAAQVRQ